jgi:Tfp pilus assembly protein PilE
MMGIETIIAVVGVVASVASTAYSGISSHQTEVEAHKEAREQKAALRAGEAKTAASAQEAAKAESERLQKRRGFMSTVKTGMGGITEEPGQKTTLGG